MKAVWMTGVYTEKAENPFICPIFLLLNYVITLYYHFKSKLILLIPNESQLLLSVYLE